MSLAMNFSGIGCFEGTFSFQVKDANQLYQLPPRQVAYTLQEPLNEKLDYKGSK